MKIKDSDILLLAGSALILGLFIGYFSIQKSFNISQQQAQVLSSESAIEALKLSAMTDCDFDQVWDGKQCIVPVFSDVYLKETGGVIKSDTPETKYEENNFLSNFKENEATNEEKQDDFALNFEHGTKIFTLWTNFSNDWSLNVCPVSSVDCPGYGQKIKFTLVGGGSGGQDGAAANSSSTGLSGPGGGGVGGSTGGAAQFDFLIPNDGLLTSFSGKIGLQGLASDYGTYPNSGTGSNIKAFYDGNIYTLAIARGAVFVPVNFGQTDFVSIGGTGTVGVQTSINSTPPPILNSSISNAIYSGLPGGPGILNIVSSTFPGNGNGVCYGSVGGSGTIGWTTIAGVFGSGGPGGHGGYNNSFPDCTAHGENYGWTGGINGFPGVVIASW